MFSLSFLLILFVSGCMLPILVKGALSDIKSRTFPKSYWNMVGIPATFAVIQYLVMGLNGEFYMIGLSVIIALASGLFCAFMGFRFGSGGDWRALMYIGIISPLLFIPTFVISLFAGAVLVVAAYIRLPKGSNPLTMTVPFAVAILAGYVGAIGIFVWTNL